MRSAYLLGLLSLCALNAAPAHAAACDKGPTPSILIFDMDATPLKPAGTTMPPGYTDLYKSSLGFFNGLKKGPDAACLRVVDLGWIPEMDFTVMGSRYFPGLPAEDMWMGTDYTAQGKITKTSDNKYALTITVEDSQTRDVVAMRQHVFANASDAINAGQIAAKSMSPLFNTIRKFQKAQRDKAGDTAIEAVIHINAAKAKIAVGEKLDATLTLQDFDGTPLKNRKVTVLGDDTGDVSTNTVTTDDTGKANFQVTGKQVGLATISASYECLNVTHKVVTTHGLATFQVGTPPPNTWELVMTASRHVKKTQQKEPPRASSGDSSTGREDSTANVTAWFAGPTASELKAHTVKFLKPIAFSGGGEFYSILTHRTWAIDPEHKNVTNMDTIQRGILDIPKYVDLSFEGDGSKATLSFSVVYRCTYEEDTNVLDSSKKNYHLNSSLPAYVNTFMFSPYLGGSAGHLAPSEYDNKRLHFQWAGNDTQGDGAASPQTTTAMTIDAVLRPMR